MFFRHAAGALLLAVAIVTGEAHARTVPESPAARALDSDHDGLSDELEQALLHRFLPAFHIESADCGARPARFSADEPAPTIAVADGTIYGQASPRPAAPAAQPVEIELHFFHLWSVDCGPHGHPLDAEHVSALLLLTPGLPPGDAASWHAGFWYAAAHEDTVCDISQITRASTLDATDHGAGVWISPGKHASFLALPLCGGGCGGDRCRHSTALSTPRLLNLGEVQAPMNGGAWVRSPRWPLAVKMARSDFPPASLTRLQGLPATDIAWVRPGRHPELKTIAVSGATRDALAHSADSTGNALERSGHNTDVALTLAGNSTGNALEKSYDKTRGALVRSAKGVGRMLHPHASTADSPPK